jgi:hypothetical protein
VIHYHTILYYPSHSFIASVYMSMCMRLIGGDNSNDTMVYTWQQTIISCKSSPLIGDSTIMLLEATILTPTYVYPSCIYVSSITAIFTIKLLMVKMVKHRTQSQQKNPKKKSASPNRPIRVLYVMFAFLHRTIHQHETTR